MLLVMDTSVLVAGLRSSLGASFVFLREVSAGKVELLATPALFLEYEEVLMRTQHNLPVMYVESFLAELATRITPVEIWYQWRPLLTDPDDEMVLEAAINGCAEAIVTHNKRDFLPQAKRFGVEVHTPAEVLLKLSSERR